MRQTLLRTVLALLLVSWSGTAFAELPELPEALLLLPNHTAELSLSNAWPKPRALRKLRKSFDTADPRDGLEIVKRQYALEQIEALTTGLEQIEAHRQGDPLPDAPPGDHDESIAQIEALLVQQPELLEPRALLALGQVAAGQPNPERLSSLLQEPTLSRYHTALALALLRVTHEPDLRARAWSTLENLPARDPQTAFVLLEQVREDRRSRRPMRLEKALFELFDHLAAHGDLSQMLPGVRDPLFLELVDTGAVRVGGWMRILDVLELFGEEDTRAELAHLAHAHYVEDEAPMHQAYLGVYIVRQGFAQSEDLQALEEAVSTAEGLETAEGPALCLEVVHALYESQQTQVTGADELARRCAQLNATGPMSQQAMLDLYDALHHHYPKVFTDRDHARYALLLVDAGLGSLAYSHIDAVDANALTGELQQRFSVLAAQRLFSQMRIEIGPDDCLVLHATRATRSELELSRLIELTDPEQLDARQRYVRHRMRATLSLKTGRYPDALDDVEAMTLLRSDAETTRDIERFVGCLTAAQRWPELVDLTTQLRNLPEERREPLQERFGAELVEAHIAWSHTLHLAGDNARAVEVLLSLRKRWTVHPREAEVLLATAELLDLTEQPREALAYYTTLYELYPEHESADMALFASALILRDLGMPEEALPLLERITREYASGVYATRALEEIEALEP